MDGTCKALTAGPLARRRSRRTRGWTGCAAALASALTALPTAATEAPKPKVLTSCLPMYCLAANVAGEFAEVENLLPAGVDPHEFQFAPRDLRRLAAADLIVVNGLGLEDWLMKALDRASGRRSLRIVEAAAGLSGHLLESPGARRPEPGSRRAPQAGSFNPHVWLDPLLAAHSVTNVQRALAQIDPPNADGYARNARAFVARLRQLDEEIRAVVATFRQRHLVTQHDAFAYFARRYGLQMVGVLHEAPEVEPSPRHRKRLAEIIRDRGVKVIFIEPHASSRLARQIARDLGLTVAELDPLESGPPEPAAYEEGLRRNLRVLEQHLK